MIKRIETAFLLTLIGVLLGFMLTVQLRSTHAVRWPPPPLRIDESSKLLDSLASAKHTNEALEAKISDLQAQVDRYEKQVDGDMGAMAPDRQKLEDYQILAGTVPVHGPGVKVIIDDHHGPIPVGVDPRYAIVHDFDLRRVVNELYAGGAEAVSINGERMAVNTGVVCIGPTIRVGLVRLVPPFTIEAIGDPQKMTSQLNRPGGILDLLRSRTVTVTGPVVQADLHLKSATGLTG
ncbi:DUF881 domain-containing protein [Kyrpidia spormannii]|uniref:Uncharacterized protein n=2 Tax=Kyrpidia spormannii TaxID=2055160 RepID=A0ACA8Z8C2_9BACL|nr:DUF881 domain-containing protein [Kyrpidia spormannii]CAB3391800.1 conserved protein of unknown function [Kyrpidia spormannii]CAB3392717.1 conserved protein of unknown function [Kyrpidia spormannii]